MAQIKCPKCGEVFQIDEAGYAQIVKQVRDKEFQAEIERREKAYSEEKKNAVDLAVSKLESQKREEFTSVKESLEKKIAELEKQVSNFEAEKRLAVSDKENEITKLKSELEAGKTTSELAVKTAVQEKEKELLKLQNELDSAKSQNEIQKKNLIEKYTNELSLKEEELAHYKEFKAKQSTKMIGESLEQFCYTEFQKIRAAGFINSYFEKDNDAKEGSKGDFIFRDYSDDKVEYISIMFEMKNEMETTSTKHKNEDFFDKLDKDRKKKNCEYAVLVSMLEEDNEYYNQGIVDVSYRYPKMYVIRPQFFIPLITILRNAALNSLQYQRELVQVKNQNIDVTHFEEDITKFKDAFNKHRENAKKQFDLAIKEIDATIEHLVKVKESLLVSDGHLEKANNKLEDLSVKKLTKNNPTMKEIFASQGNNVN